MQSRHSIKSFVLRKIKTFEKQFFIECKYETLKMLKNYAYAWYFLMTIFVDSTYKRSNKLYLDLKRGIH